MKQLRPFDILKLPTGGVLYESKVSELTVMHLLTEEEDILCSESLISSGKVWETLFNMLVKEKDQLKWDEMYFIDQFAFMWHIRMVAYGAEVEYSLKNPITGNKETYVYDLSKIEFPKIDFGDMVDGGLFKYTLPKTKRVVLYRLLNAKQKEDVIKKANKYRNDLNLSYDPKIKYTLEQSIVSVDGNSDSAAVQKFISSGEMPISDSYNLRKEIASKLPEPDLKQEVTTSAGNKFVKDLNLDTTFFFPALYI